MAQVVQCSYGSWCFQLGIAGNYEIVITQSDVQVERDSCEESPASVQVAAGSE